MIDILVRSKRCTSWETYGATRLAPHLPSRVVVLDEGNFAAYLQEIRQNPPLATLSFSAPIAGGTPFCTLTGVPHLLWTEGHLAGGLDYLSTPLGYVGVHDPALAGERRLYLPFGAQPQTSRERPFKTVLFEGLKDLAELETMWQAVHPGEDVARWKAAPLLEVPHEYLSLIEEYQLAQRTLAYVRQGGGGHFFGDHLGNNWLVSYPHLKLHYLLPFSEYFEVLALTETFVASAGSPWIGPALAAGCRVVDHQGESLKAPLPTWKEQAEKILAWAQKKAP